MRNSNTPIKVLMVVPNLRVSNGVASFVISYYRKIDHNKVNMDFVCYRNIESPYVQEIEKNGDRVFFLPSIKKYRAHVRYCKKIVEQGKYDIIHDNSLLITYPILKAAKKRIGVRILHSHNSKLGDTKFKALRNRLLRGLLLRNCNCFAACSSIAGNALFRSSSFDIIPNVIEPSSFDYDDGIRNRKRLEEGCFNKTIIGTVGRLAYQKNPFFAIDVIEKVLSLRDDVEYWWIGSGGLDNEVQQYVEDKKLTERIKLLGSRTDVPDLYQAMDLFFLPSKFEGFGLACLEAQTSGLFCIVSTEFPKEIDVTGCVQQISLGDSLDIWASSVLRALEKRIDRRKGFTAVNSSVYSTGSSGNKLVEYYMKQLDNLGED